MDYQKPYLVCCGILRKEIEKLIEDGQLPVEPFFLEAGLHVNPDELEEQVQLYIEILKSKKAAEALEKLMMSKHKCVQEHAEKTLKLLKENKMPKSNLENNLFLLMLIDNDISIGRYRKIFYKKE